MIGLVFSERAPSGKTLDSARGQSRATKLLSTFNLQVSGLRPITISAEQRGSMFFIRLQPPAVVKTK